MEEGLLPVITALIEDTFSKYTRSSSMTEDFESTM